MGASAQLVHTSEALDNLGHKADGMAQKIEKLAGMALATTSAAETFAQLEKRMGELLNQVAEAKRVSEKLTAPDGELHQHRQAAELMGSQAREAQATLSALRQEGEKLDQLHTKLRASTAEMAQATDGVASLKSELETLRSSQSGLRQEMQDARESARVARADSTAAVQDVNEMHGKLESFAQLQELSREHREAAGVAQRARGARGPQDKGPRGTEAHGRARRRRGHAPERDGVDHGCAACQACGGQRADAAH